VWYAEDLPEGSYRVLADHHICRSAKVLNNQETRLDFNISTGDVRIEGYINAAGGLRIWIFGFAPVYLFLPGTCRWKSGQDFIPPTTADGFFVLSRAKGKNRYLFRDIPHGTYELVAIHLEEGKIMRMEKRKVTLTAGEKLNIDFNLMD
jgi:hypothetical protein